MVLPRRFLALAAGALLVAGAARPDRPAPLARAVRHTVLLRSEPAKDSTVLGTPAHIFLLFSAPVDLAASRIQLLGPDAKPVPLPPVGRRGANDATVQALVLTELVPGPHVVRWATASADGHAVSGQFRFTVKAP